MDNLTLEKSFQGFQTPTVCVKDFLSLKRQSSDGWPDQKSAIISLTIKYLIVLSDLHHLRSLLFQFLIDRLDHTSFCSSSHMNLQLICDDRQRIWLFLYFHCLCVRLQLTCATRIVTERKSDLVSAWISNKMRAFYRWIAAWQSQLIVSLWQVFPPYSRIIL